MDSTGGMGGMGGMGGGMEGLGGGDGMEGMDGRACLSFPVLLALKHLRGIFLS